MLSSAQIFPLPLMPAWQLDLSKLTDEQLQRLAEIRGAVLAATPLQHCMHDREEMRLAEVWREQARRAGTQWAHGR